MQCQRNENSNEKKQVREHSDKKSNDDKQAKKENDYKMQR